MPAITTGGQSLLLFDRRRIRVVRSFFLAQSQHAFASLHHALKARPPRPLAFALTRRPLLALALPTDGGHVALSTPSPMISAGNVLRVHNWRLDVLRFAGVRWVVVADDVTLAWDSSAMAQSVRQDTRHAPPLPVV